MKVDKHIHLSHPDASPFEERTPNELDVDRRSPSFRRRLQMARPDCPGHVWIARFPRLQWSRHLARAIRTVRAAHRPRPHGRRPCRHRTNRLVLVGAHWRAYRAYPLTHVKLLGYVAVAVLALCLISGLVVTWQPVFGTRLAYSWRAIHRWTMVAIALFGMTHLAIVMLRDRALHPAAIRAFTIWTTAGTWGPFALVAAVAVVLGAPQLQQTFPAGYERWHPTNKLYADNTAFAPSLARTAHNGPIDPALLAGSEHCGTAGCHTQIVAEWQPSAHRYAAMDKAFQAIQLTMARQNGATSTRYCGGCHDPISLFSGAKNIAADEASLTGLHGYQEGISCLSCHAIRQTDIRGNAQYTVQAPRGTSVKSSSTGLVRRRGGSCATSSFAPTRASTSRVSRKRCSRNPSIAPRATSSSSTRKSTGSAGYSYRTSSTTGV